MGPSAPGGRDISLAWKLPVRFTVRASGLPLMNKIDLLLMLGALVAAFGVCVVCGLGLVVWLAGGNIEPRK
jgi:hypothetical protein